MSFEHPITLAEAIDEASSNFGAEPALLLGNGFSIAFDEARFRYSALLEVALPNISPELKTVFKLYDTANFEGIMEALEKAASIVGIYQGPKALREQIGAEVNALRMALVTAIEAHHPEKATAVSQAQRKACEKFLWPYRAIFTTNYDLLLYWIINGSTTLQAKFRDGFTRPVKDGPLRWKRPEDQTTHYLHGALHLVEVEDFEEDLELEKLEWDGEVPILESVERLLNNGRVPLIVSEGSAHAKAVRISEKDYLRHCLGALRQNDRPMVIFGFSFGASDAHLAQAIAQSRSPQLYVGLHGNGRGAIKDKVDSIISKRKNVGTLPALGVEFFDASVLSPWQ